VVDYTHLTVAYSVVDYSFKCRAIHSVLQYSDTAEISFQLIYYVYL